MVKEIKAYFETLEGLSTEALDRSAEKLVRAEKRNVALLIAHIAEMSRRKAELECGYKNLFDYCVRRLNLSEGSVALRIQVANVSRSLKAKFERLAKVLGVENPLKHMAEIFERAVDISLEKKDPKRKRERRLERKRKQGASREKSRPDEILETEGM